MSPLRLVVDRGAGCTTIVLVTRVPEVAMFKEHERPLGMDVVGALPVVAAAETIHAWVLRHVAWRADELGLRVEVDFGRRWREGELAGHWNWIAGFLDELPVDAPATVVRDALEGARDHLNAAVRAYYRDGKGPGRLAAKTARNVWTVVTTAFRQMQQAEKKTRLRVREDNPALGIAPPKPPTKMSLRSARARKKILRPLELMKLAACEDVPRKCSREEWWEWRATCVIVAYLYPRPDEARMLECADVDFQAKRVSISKAWNSERRELTDPKTPAGRRFVPIWETLVPLLRELCERRGGRGLLLPVLSEANDKNHARKLRRFLTHAGITREDLFAGAGSTRERQMTFRQLRDTGISWRMARGDNPRTVMKAAGHMSLAQTEEYSGSADTLLDSEGRRWIAEYGEPFGPLPASLVGEGRRNEGGYRRRDSNPARAPEPVSLEPSADELVGLAMRFLFAASAREESSDELARELARAELAHAAQVAPPDVTSARLALEVLEGGGFMFRRATELARRRVLASKRGRLAEVAS